MAREHSLRVRRGHLLVSLRVSLAVCLLTALGAILGHSSAWAGGGDLLWEDRFGLTGSGGFSLNTASAITAANGKVFATGYGPETGSPRSNADIFVRAYEPRTGRVLWASRWDESGHDDSSTAITTIGDVVLVTGIGSTNFHLPGHGDHFIVRAYDAGTGEDLWTDSLDQVDGLGCRPGALTVAAQGTLAFAGGCVLRAYDARTGTLAWQGDGALALAAEGSQLFAVGFSASGLSLRAHDGQTGAVSWEVPLDGAAVFVEPQKTPVLASGRGAVFVTFTDTSRGRHLVSFDADTGTLRWQADLGAVVADTTPQSAITLDAGRVFVAGQGNDYVAQAYDAQSGELLWTAEQADEVLRGLAVAAGGGQVFVAGHSGDFQFVVQTYDAVDGHFIWGDRATEDGGGAVTVASAGGRVFVGGTRAPSSFPFNLSYYLVRAYDAGPTGPVASIDARQ